MWGMRPWLVAPLTLLAGCASLQTAAGPAAPSGVLREAELARVRCLVLTPLENASDAPLAAGAATEALSARLDPARTQALEVGELRALFADTPLELPEGVSATTALELAELLGADAALYGTVEGRSRDGAPELLVTVRLALAGSRTLLFADALRVVPAAHEAWPAAVRRTVQEGAAPMLERLGATGRATCFPRERREALRAAALALRSGGPAPPPTAAAPRSPPSTGPSATRRPTLHTERQREWSRALSGNGRVVLEDVAFVGRTADLARDGGLADLAVVLSAQPDLTVRLEGFVDTSGDPGQDARLSREMVQAAAQRLVDLGVEARRITTAGRGGESPILPNFTVRGRAANRRVEVVASR
jgi:outer membrane protein OmpA-like peptidoglycan-associated protein